MIADSPTPPSGWDARALAAQSLEFVEQAGKDNTARRDRLRGVIQFAVDYYHQLMKSLADAPLQVDAQLARALQRVQQDGSPDSDMAVACLERCLEAQAQVDANANLATLIECWLDDLESLTRGSLPFPS